MVEAGAFSLSDSAFGSLSASASDSRLDRTTFTDSCSQRSSSADSSSHPRSSNERDQSLAGKQSHLSANLISICEQATTSSACQSLAGQQACAFSANQRSAGTSSQTKQVSLISFEIVPKATDSSNTTASQLPSASEDATRLIVSSNTPASQLPKVAPQNSDNARAPRPQLPSLPCEASASPSEGHPGIVWNCYCVKQMHWVKSHLLDALPLLGLLAMLTDSLSYFAQFALLARFVAVCLLNSLSLMLSD